CAPVWLDREDLVDLGPVRLEVHRRARHVEPPDARPGRTDERNRLVPCPLEVGDPAPQGLRVVLTERLDMADLEAGLLHDRHHPADLVELAVGEHVPLDEPRPREPRSGAGADRRPQTRTCTATSTDSGWTADAVVEEPGAGRQQLEEPPEVLGEARLADVFEHADRTDRVVRSVGDRAVVLVANLHP